MGQGRNGRIRALIWVGDVENTDIGRHLDPSDLKVGQPLRGPRFSTVQFVTRPVPNGLRLVRFGMGDGKGQWRNTAKVKAAHGGGERGKLHKNRRELYSPNSRGCEDLGEDYANCTEQRVICTVWRFWSVNGLVRLTRALTFGWDG